MPATNSHQLWPRSAGGAAQQLPDEIRGHNQAGITMIIVVGLNNMDMIDRKLASSVWQGVHEDPEI